MSKHTAGQWDVIYKFGTAVGIRAGKSRQYVNGEAQDQIVMIVPCAEYNGGSEATEANARLIAAAPELLEALMASRKALEVATTPLAKDRQEVLTAMKLADSAIAKVNGDQV